ncbi:hypothetical protein [Clostridium sp. UBA7503]|uniref:hypothetical protein n=1 Tax=Clostridium sp. UBA7503 TaxID=1946377 RepID=UPI003217D143
MKEYSFSEASKRYMRKQLSNSILLSSLLLIITIGLFIRNNLFYGRFLLVFSIVGLIVTGLVTKKIRIIDELNYIKVYKDKFCINNNMNGKSKIFYFKDVYKARRDNKGIIFYVGKRDYRILSSFLEQSEVDELWKKFSRYK